MAPRRVLLLLNQLPGDPASGAARSMLTTAAFLAEHPEKYDVWALGTSGSEKGAGLEMKDYFQQMGVVPQEGIFAGRVVWRYQIGAGRGQVKCQVLDVGKSQALAWEKTFAGVMDDLLAQTLRRHKFDLAITFGGHAEAVRRRKTLKAAGCKVIFGLRNHGYYKSGAFVDVDAIFTPSRFLTESYARKIGVTSTPLTVPLEMSDVVAASHERVFITAVNPDQPKGVYFLARLAEELSLSRPDIPWLVVESRGGGSELVTAGLQGGFDLRRHENLMLSPGVAKPRDIYAVTRVLLVPSVWEEPSGRVAAEALVNGIVPIVSDRGGLPETVGEGGIVLALPPGLTVETQTPVSAAAVEEWKQWVVQLVDDQAEYARRCGLAVQAGERFSPERVKAETVAFFDSV